LFQKPELLTIFVEKMKFCLALAVMHILALSNEPETLRHVARIFSHEVSDITCVGDVSQFGNSARSGEWKIFLIDYDLLKSHFPDPVAFMEELSSDAQFILVGSHNFADWHDQLRSAGAIVLHKPNTVGEFGIALRKLGANRAQKEAAS
jgi:hypothetical protein